METELRVSKHGVLEIIRYVVSSYLLTYSMVQSPS